MSGAQRFQVLDEQVKDAFLNRINESSPTPRVRLTLSWSNWMFGREELPASLERLARAGLKYVELHGNRYTKDLGYSGGEVRRALRGFDIQVSGICGMFGPENDLSSPKPWVRQQAIDYIRRNLELAHEVAAQYFLIVPGAVGRPEPIDEYEFERSIDTLSKVADEFSKAGVKGAIEPIRSAEVSIVHTFAEAAAYIEKLNHPAVKWINGDVYHMAQEEPHIGATILQYGDYLLNLHLADTNRRALGEGMLDVDVLIMALYAIRYELRGGFVTAEPLGPGANPYKALESRPDPRILDALVKKTVHYFRTREDVVLSRWRDNK